jgi:NRPS condensation-like uncharacterized protein
VARNVAEQQLHCVIVFNGHVDAERMSRAARLTLDAEPVLGCRFACGPRRPYRERRRDLDRLTLCRVIDTNDSEHLLWNWVGTPLEPASDPVVQARFLPSDHDTPCVKMDHTAADAGGTKEYAYLLAKIYRTLAAEPDYVPQPNVHGGRVTGQVRKHVRPWTLVDAWRYRSPQMPGWGFPGA